MDIVLDIFVTLNQLLSAGISITAFSLLFYAFTFNLRDRVARSFAIILLCVVAVFVGDTFASIGATAREIEAWLRFQWIGIVFLPAAYLQFSDALLATTGRPSRGRRRWLTRLTYLISFGFLLTLPLGLLVGPLVVDETTTVPHLQRTPLAWVFTGYYALGMVWAWVNFYRSHQRTVTRSSQRRMRYLIAGALAPALGSFPYLLFGSGFAARHMWIFWLAVTLSNFVVYGLLVVMAYSVAFFGVSWPDRIVKRRLFKWLMRGPVAASLVLALTVVVRRTGQFLNLPYEAAIPITMVVGILVIEHVITLVAPIWERWIFHGGDRENMHLLQTLEERLLTSGDLHQFLEAVLAAVCDRLQVDSAFVVGLERQGPGMVVTVGNDSIFWDDVQVEFLNMVEKNGFGRGLFSWQDHWLVPLYGLKTQGKLLGLLGVKHNPAHMLDDDQREALARLSRRAATALDDRQMQQQVFTSLENLTPQMDEIQRLRAAARYAGTNVLTSPDESLENRNISRWVKDALSHYWGGPKLTNSPLMRLQVVQQAMESHDGNPSNALRAILDSAIEQTRPEGERRFTGEWILYNILEMKFMEGHKVREIARRLAMSEADLYRKQRVAIEAVASTIVEMEQRAREEETEPGKRA